jgi:hypothetical protein
MKKLLASGLAGAFLSTSAFAVIHIRGEEGKVTERTNIDIPTDTFTYEQASEVINGFADWVKEGKTEVVFSDILKEVRVPGDFQKIVQKVVDSRAESATVLCHDQKCKITSPGTPITFKVDGVDLPIVGTPSITLAKTINIYTRVSENRQTLEICRIEGVNIKVSILNPTLDGAIIEVENGAVKNIRVDAGSGGDYPTQDCDFNPADIAL